MSRVAYIYLINFEYWNHIIYLLHDTIVVSNSQSYGTCLKTSNLILVSQMILFVLICSVVNDQVYHAQYVADKPFLTD